MKFADTRLCFGGEEMEEPWYSYWPRPYKVRRDGKKGNDVDINSPSVDLELMTIVYCVSFIEDSASLASQWKRLIQTQRKDCVSGTQYSLPMLQTRTDPHPEETQLNTVNVDITRFLDLEPTRNPCQLGSDAHTRNLSTWGNNRVGSDSHCSSMYSMECLNIVIFSRDIHRVGSLDRGIGHWTEVSGIERRHPPRETITEEAPGSVCGDLTEHTAV
ncbi:hypothetical protein RRG08_002672 [Elysia crispata]|uniref:Uncharacterized protein n=1 Tax=Elysia crispata TaxID=231223 RepID=A0AAE0XV42_9GAST|nr:hypothetical protein RRG08_002672 [Elysia crispata]